MHLRHRILGAALALGFVIAIVPVVAGPEKLSSGVEIGASLPAYNPQHVTGPDKDTNTCPVCKYPRNPSVQAWIHTDDEKNVKALVKELEKIAKANPDAKFKPFVVFVNGNRESGEVLGTRLREMGKKLGLEHVALTYLPGPDHHAVKGYGINTDPAVKNTIFVYKNRTVAAKFVNLKADEKGLAQLREAVSKVL